jgi:hypothetical protein
VKVGNIIGGALFFLFVAFCIFLLYLMVVFLPVSLWAESRCLAKGYPKTEVTIGLSVYCLNLDGAVTTKVERLQ